jgi:2-polyprenyl-3-methyl-5-hydroxy-6-metoxy-1,4-benzoquinol methylase
LTNTAIAFIFSNMPSEKTEWKKSTLVDRFNTHKAFDEIHPDAAVNIFVGWPSFFEQIKYQAEFLDKKKLNILDFGCGAGEFIMKLHMLGHTTFGIDASAEMLDLARRKLPKEIQLWHKDEVEEDGGESNDYFGKMDVVTSIHSFDWNDDVETIIKHLDKFLAPNGLFIFAVFPKKHVIESLKIKDLFTDFDSDSNPTKGICDFDGVRVPVYVKEPVYYDKLFCKMDYEKVLEYYPPYPTVFLKKYKWHGAMYPEMLILAYRKPAAKL